jgi:hypothetical protein
VTFNESGEACVWVMSVLPNLDHTGEDTTMTTDRIALWELLEKGSDIDPLREMIGFVAERLMALEVKGLRGAGDGERTPARPNQRNGFRTGVGDAGRYGRAEVPKLRKGTYFPGCLEFRPGTLRSRSPASRSGSSPPCQPLLDIEKSRRPSHPVPPRSPTPK